MTEDADPQRVAGIVAAIVGAVFVVGILLFGSMSMGTGSMMGTGHMMWDSGAAPGWFIFIGFLLQILFLVAIIGGAYLVVRAVTGTDHEEDRALEELRLAYARGDLSDEEYEQRREKLEQDE
jgi:putative membrane protein